MNVKACCARSDDVKVDKRLQYHWTIAWPMVMMMMGEGEGSQW